MIKTHYSWVVQLVNRHLFGVVKKKEYSFDSQDEAWKYYSLMMKYCDVRFYEEVFFGSNPQPSRTLLTCHSQMHDLSLEAIERCWGEEEHSIDDYFEESILASEGSGETSPESFSVAFNGLVDGAGEFPLWEKDSHK